MGYSDILTNPDTSLLMPLASPGNKRLHHREHRSVEHSPARLSVTRIKKTQNKAVPITYL